MSQTTSLALTDAQRSLVLEILRAHLPPAARVLVFGSRAHGRPRPYSDLDLAIDAGRPLALVETAAIADAFSESDLPWKVDLVDLNSIGSIFAQTIEHRSTPLTTTPV